jgi:sulfate/thiosulfate-binding protein
MTTKPILLTIGVAVMVGVATYFFVTPSVKTKSMLHVSYDPTRELYQDYNAGFIQSWQQKTGEKVAIRQSHGGSGKQARSVIDGLDADIVSLALAYDIDAISQKTHKIPTTWQSRLPANSAPYSSTIVFLVRKGNPKHIQNWDDLAKPGIAVITPNPKTSGAARWAYLAAWGYYLHLGKSEQEAQAFLKQIIQNVPVLDSGARGATTTFVERGVGDVLLTWENEALLAISKLKKAEFEMVYPAISIVAEPPVAIVDKNTLLHGTESLAKAYVEGLYTEASQHLIAKHYYRPSDPAILAQYRSQFPDMPLFRLADHFGDWETAQKRHFDDGGSFDQVFKR